MTLTVKCPHCAACVPWTAEQTYKPFCSQRCRLIDLGQWFAEQHAIAGTKPADNPALDPFFTPPQTIRRVINNDFVVITKTYSLTPPKAL